MRGRRRGEDGDWSGVAAEKGDESGGGRRSEGVGRKDDRGDGRQVGATGGCGHTHHNAHSGIDTVHCGCTIQSTVDTVDSGARTGRSRPSRRSAMDSHCAIAHRLHPACLSATRLTACSCLQTRVHVATSFQTARNFSVTTPWNFSRSVASLKAVRGSLWSLTCAVVGRAHVSI